ncbi:TetR family transcriptional regulator [Prauserella shujinwangii]|uniref:TetR family transcriptional regulator n=1 Tax=Prauserella shujinwangii TaxID=1453103 RepID=A0A2T0LZB8_9PSEU|nr:TetR family transcriptional regulator [Prauserella shujinwangii]PRX49461.1 TetR family transcriptional regulator [Prauserella shujinwangii]
MARREEPPQLRDVRGRLLAAAAELIPEAGWQAVSTRSVAQRAGVTPGLVHYHFGSVRRLLAEAALGVAGRSLDEVAAMLPEAPDARTLVARLVGAIDVYTGSDPASRLLLEASLAADRDPELRAGLGELMNRFRDALAGRLGELGVPGAGATAAVLVAALDGIVLHRALGPAPDPHAVAAVLGRLATGREGAECER